MARRPQIFDQDPELYDEVRPVPPCATLDDLTRLRGLPPEGRVLEIGCGTGQATRPLAERGYRILALEMGARLAAVARRNLASYRHVEVRSGTFEDWPPEAASFDLFLSVQAFHWIDPSFGVARAAQVLRPGGWVALLWHLDRSRGSPFYRATDPIYARTFARAEVPFSLSDWAEVYRSALERSKAFGPVVLRRYPWQQRYTREAYLNLLRTFSDATLISAEAHRRFLDEIGAVIDAFGGEVVRDHETVAVLARRLP